jgi:hypothetical protein
LVFSALVMITTLLLIDVALHCEIVTNMKLVSAVVVRWTCSEQAASLRNHVTSTHRWSQDEITQSANGIDRWCLLTARGTNVQHVYRAYSLVKE